MNEHKERREIFKQRFLDEERRRKIMKLNL